MKIKAFTLVELIVVITILAILWTIGFVSLSGYAKTSRDSVRVSDISTITKSLEIFWSMHNVYPSPNNMIELLASWKTLSLQGEAWTWVLNSIKVFDAIDPVSNNYYSYVTNPSKTNYQILSKLESDITYRNIDKVEASSQIFFSKGDNIWLIYSGWTDTPIYKWWTDVDLLQGNQVYDLVISDNPSEIYSGTGWEIFRELLYNLETNYAQNDQLMILDQTLMGYWDMQTIENSGALVDVKDMTGNGHTLVCFSGTSTQQSCGAYLKKKWDKPIITMEHDWHNLRVPSLYNTAMPDSGTLHLWFVDNETYHTIFDNRNDTRDHFFIRRVSNNSYQFSVMKAWPWPYLLTTWFNLEWWENQLTFSWDYDTTIWKFYINWKLFLEGPIEAGWKPDGQRFTFSNNYNRWHLFALSLYDRVLSSDEIKKIYNINKN